MDAFAFNNEGIYGIDEDCLHGSGILALGEFVFDLLLEVF
jgi:hypothetical protein